MSTNFLTFVGNALTNLYSAQGGFIAGIGTNIFWSLAVLQVLLIGAEVMVGGMREWEFVKRIGIILIVGSILGTYPAAPHVIIDEAKDLSGKFEAAAGEQVQAKISEAVAKTEQPSSGFIMTVTSIIQSFWYGILMLLLSAMRLLLVGVLAVSYLALGLLVLLGPILVPWLLVPGLEHLAWGWLNAVIHYSLYQVIAGAVVFINSNVMLGFFSIHPLPWAAADLPTLVVELVVVFGIGLYFVLLVPSFASGLVQGAGLSAVRQRGV